MNKKVEFRKRAKAQHKAALELMDKDEDDLLLFAALKLRMALECIAYEILQSFEEDVIKERMETWQPGKLIKELKEIDRGVESDHHISIGWQENQDEPAKEMHSLGVDQRVKGSWLNASYNALGSYLHEPTVRQHRDQNFFDPEAARIKMVKISGEISRVLDSSIHAINLNVGITFSCECGAPMKRRVELLQCAGQIECGNCGRIWLVEKTGEVWRREPAVHNSVCPSCGKTNSFPAKVLKEGDEFECSCGVTSVAKQDWCLKIKNA
ncbi:hypothetical protein SAMN04488041_103130 [Sulfitobacter pontiacus]|uniref:Uncharacterized protein n=1 Tax=Sulfitobacter pontiacus TaxID=60137 RepID=A0A1H2W2E7_9RHOB|nr:hypothetical protein [Sulfitobacter pontiacus]SDW74687.1 hypothetical protein SAMN04488041_103130 [Sulfitobacter pontiacus]